MPIGNLGVVFPYEVAETIGEDLSVVARGWRWVNRNPLFTRLRMIPCSQVEYKSQGSDRRPETVQVTVAATAADTVLTLADVTYLQNGDTLELTFANNSTEQMEIVADPNEAASTITVQRGDAFTTPGIIPVNTVLRLLGNARTGGEKWQKGISPKSWKRSNWIQTFQNPVEVAGILEDTTAFRGEVYVPGGNTPLDTFRMVALGNMVDDFERAIVYQRGMAPTDSNSKRAKTKGLRQQIQDAGGYQNQPTDYAAYSPYSLLRDVAEGPAGAGGAPNLYYVSSDWVGGLARWKMPLAQLDMGSTAFDVRIEAFKSSVAPNATFVVAPRLKPGTVMALNEADTFLRFMRKPTWKKRGNSGDVEEGDIIARIGVQLDNPDQARYIEGITGFAAA